MKKECIVCDRCDKKIEKGTGWLLSSITDRNYDICDSCVDDIDIKEKQIEF